MPTGARVEPPRVVPDFWAQPACLSGFIRVHWRPGGYGSARCRNQSRLIELHLFPRLYLDADDFDTRSQNQIRTSLTRVGSLASRQTKSCYWRATSEG